VAPPSVPVPPPAYGGTETVLDTLARALQAAGHDVLLATTGDASCPVPRTWCIERAAGVGVGGTDVELRHAVHAHQAAREWDADIVHDHTMLGALLGPALASAPVVTTNHGPFDVPALSALFAAIADQVHIIAISADQASAAGTIPIAATIHHGVDLDRFPPGAGGGGYALFLGRMHPDKGVHIAARVARMAEVPLLIAAKKQEPHEVEYFDAQVRPLLTSEVRYVGEVSNDDKAELLGDAMCLLNPIQWSEPFGMVMIEAMATGTPVVATPFGSVPEIVTDARTGYLRTDERDLARAVLASTSLDREQCRAEVQARFSAERMAADHLDLYQRLMLRRDDVVGAA